MIILLTGLPGTGKTEVARIFAKKLKNTKIIRNDEIRNELFGVAGGKWFSEDQDALMERTVIDRTKKLVENGENVILDRVSPTAEKRQKFRDLAKELDAIFYLISVSAPEELVEERMENRLKEDPLGVPFAVYHYWKGKFQNVDSSDFTIINNGNLADLEKKVSEINII